MDDDPDTRPRRRSRLGSWRFWLLVAVAAFVVMQLVPYGRDHSNPKVVTTPAWTSAEVEQLAMDSCGDCHSNLTTWPWYSNVAPASWLVQRDVDEGRSAFNWSEGCAEADEIGEVILEGEMPPAQYTLIHRNAKLSDAEQRTLADGLAKSISRASGYRECEGGE